MKIPSVQIQDGHFHIIQTFRVQFLQFAVLWRQVLRGGARFRCRSRDRMRRLLPCIPWQSSDQASGFQTKVDVKHVVMTSSNKHVYRIPWHITNKHYPTWSNPQLFVARPAHGPFFPSFCAGGANHVNPTIQPICMFQTLQCLSVP